MKSFAPILIFAICATLASTALSQANPKAPEVKCAAPDYNNEFSVAFDDLLEQYVLDGIKLEKCQVLKILETDVDAKCKYDESNPKQQPPKKPLLRGLPGGAEFQSWYANFKGYGILRCADGGVISDIDVKIL